jgi:hypothetical protein
MSTGRLGAGDTAIQPTILNAKGDLIVATAADTPAALTVGANGTVLTAASGEATGLQWAAPASGGFVLIASNTFSNVASVTLDDCFNSTYDTYLVTFVDCFGGTAADDAQIQWRYSTTTLTTDYYSSYMYYTTSAVGSRFQIKHKPQFLIMLAVLQTNHKAKCL